MEQVKQKIAAGAKIIDVRSPGEYSGGHFDGAVNIPVDQISGRTGDVGDKSSPVIVYCASGMRSAMAKSMLEAAGFQDVVNGGGLGDMYSL